jgi:hypothetical protein
LNGQPNDQPSSYERPASEQPATTQHDGKKEKNAKNVRIEEVEILSGLSVYPNPFALDATVRFQLAQNAKVALSVYNVLGKSVLSREMGQMAAGAHNLKLSSEGFASGMYLVTLLVGGEQQTSRISISK